MKRSIVVAGLAFGDEGKGTMTDYLTRHYDAKLVVRYNGGPQAAHNVITDSGVHHTFSQFGSGTLAGAQTFLSRHMLIDPFAMIREASVLEKKGIRKPLERITIDPRCVVITPYHRLANRIREASRGVNRHGSVGVGVGEARMDELAGYSFHAGDYLDCRGILQRVKDRKGEEIRPLAGYAPELFQKFLELDPVDLTADYSVLLGAVAIRPWTIAEGYRETVIFEGAQGVLLDETYGFAPYNSWTDCTFRNADGLCEEADCQDVLHIGVLRSYFTRHGVGPFPTETRWAQPEEAHNATHPYMGRFRLGHFDSVLAKYACQCAGKVDCLAITHVDRTPSELLCTSYENWDGEYSTHSLSAVKPVYRVSDKSTVSSIEKLIGVPVCYESYGPRSMDKLVHDSVSCVA